jgi:beta-lactamase regulating signal transducer with metallopeptidase domain
MTAALNLAELARISAGTLLNCILEGIAIGLFAWITLQLIGRRNSSTRFAVWFSALLAIAALPILDVAASSARAGNAGSAITIPSSWALDIFLVWATVATLALFRVGVGLWQLRKLRASCAPIDPATLDPSLRETLHAFQTIRPVTLCESRRVQVPTAIGFLKPLVVIPVWAMQELSTTELNSILIHELAHLRRWDDWTNLAQQVLKALLFFHPAVWWIESKLALEREMACDDAVLDKIANPRGYAQCLVSIAEKSFMRRGLALAQAAVNRVRQTSLRVSQILDANRPGATRVWKPAVYSVAAFVGVCAISLSRAPELVAFEDPTMQIARATPAMSTSSARPYDAVTTMASYHPSSSSSEKVLQPQVSVSFPAPLLASNRIRERSTFASDGIGKGTGSLAPEQSENESRLQPLKPVSAARIKRTARFENATWIEGTTWIEQTTWVESVSWTGSQQPRSGVRMQPTTQAVSGIDTIAEPQRGERAASYTENVEPTLLMNQAPALFIMMQTEQAAPRFWTITVWRVTVIDPSRVPAQTRIPTKQI